MAIYDILVGSALWMFQHKNPKIPHTNHITIAGSNGLYANPTMQNKIISKIGNKVEVDVVSRVNEDTFSSILADETSGIIIFVCSVHVPVNAKIRRSFLKFIFIIYKGYHWYCCNSEKSLLELGLDLSIMMEQHYDGAAGMSGALNGVQIIVLPEFPGALYINCSSYCLNVPSWCF